MRTFALMLWALAMIAVAFAKEASNLEVPDDIIKAVDAVPITKPVVDVPVEVPLR